MLRGHRRPLWEPHLWYHSVKVSTKFQPIPVTAGTSISCAYLYLRLYVRAWYTYPETWAGFQYIIPSFLMCLLTKSIFLH